MKDTKNIVWLASYPKSGNTWFRVFLSNLLNNTDNPVDINNLKKTPIASSRVMFDETSAFSSSDLTPSEIELLRPKVYSEMSKSATDLLYIKIHDCYEKNEKGVSMFPSDASNCVIYLVRNPLDVAVSFAHHSSCSIDRTIANMNNKSFAFCNRYDKLHNQIKQHLNDWSGHVESWLTQKDIPVHIMKYEDMKLNTFETFKKAVTFIGIQTSDENINRALEFSRFERLQEQEKQKGFHEKAPAADNFFRKGQINDYKNVLSKSQIEKIVTKHEFYMRYFNYL